MSNIKAVFVGYDKRQHDAFAVAKHSLRLFLPKATPVIGLHLRTLQQWGVYTRPTTQRDGRLFDVISDAYMSTEFAISRFLVPMLARQHLNGETGWVMFTDCDVLARRDIVGALPELDDSKAVYCVPHTQMTLPGQRKMDNQMQMPYPRKNWSSVMLFNTAHAKNAVLDYKFVNERTGRDLHGFCWLEEADIGLLPLEFNYLVRSKLDVKDPVIVHFTEGYPAIKGYENDDYAKEWWNRLRDITMNPQL